MHDHRIKHSSLNILHTGMGSSKTVLDLEDKSRGLAWPQRQSLICN